MLIEVYPGFSLASMRAPILSSCAVALNVSSFCLVNLSPFVALLITERRGIADQSTIDRAVYSDSIVLVAIVICIHDTHSTGQLAISRIFLEQDLTLLGFALHSSPQPQAKAESTKTFVLSDMVLIDFKIRPFSAVPLRYRLMQMSASLCERLGVCKKRAT